MSSRSGKLFYRIEELESLFGLSKAALYDATRKGHIPSIQIGRRRLVPSSWVKKQTQPVDAEVPRAK